MLKIKLTRGVSSGGLFNEVGTIGLISTGFDSGISSTLGFSGSGGLIFECLDRVQPLMLRNSVKSVHFLLQHDQPL